MSKGTSVDAERRFQLTTEYMREHVIPFSVVDIASGEVLERCHHDKILIDDYAIESIARAVFQDVMVASKDPQIQSEYKEWQKMQPELPKKQKARKRRRRR